MKGKNQLKRINPFRELEGFFSINFFKCDTINMHERRMMET